MEIVQDEGGRKITRTLKFYNLDAIIAVGYRVKQNRNYISDYDKELEKYINK